MTTHLLSFVYSDLALYREIIILLSPVRVYVPWGIHPPEYEYDTEITISYPPEELRPVVDINLLLGECYNWAYERGEKSRNEIIKTCSVPVTDESIQNIRAILSGKPSSAPSEKEMTIRWHMLLHLACRFEKERNEAERMIESLRIRQSPLFNNADLDDNAIYPLETLAGMGIEHCINEENFRQLLRAWQALFGGYTCEGDLFLVLNRSLFAFLCDEYKNLCINKGFQLPEVISCKIPLIEVHKDKPDAVDEIRAIFSSLESGDYPPRISGLLSGYGARHGTVKGIPRIHISVLHMKTDPVKDDTLLSMFSGRFIVLTELISHPE